MKLAILLLLLAAVSTSLVSGCGLPSKYYYKPETSLEQAKADREECYGLLIRAGAAVDYGHWSRYNDYAADCMRTKGYRLVPETRLGDDVRKEDGWKRNAPYWLAGS